MKSVCKFLLCILCLCVMGCDVRPEYFPIIEASRGEYLNQVDIKVVITPKKVGVILVFMWMNPVIWK